MRVRPLRRIQEVVAGVALNGGRQAEQQELLVFAVFADLFELAGDTDLDAPGVGQLPTDRGRSFQSQPVEGVRALVAQRGIDKELLVRPQESRLCEVSRGALLVATALDLQAHVLIPAEEIAVLPE